MLVSLLSPEIEKKVKFSSNIDVLSAVTEESGCYVITNYDDVILYIGQAVNIRNRMEQHLSDREKRGETPDGTAFWFYYGLCLEIELDSLEYWWVKQHCDKEGKLPYFNKQRPPV